MTNRLPSLIMVLESLIRVMQFVTAEPDHGNCSAEDPKKSIGDAPIVASLPAGEACSWEYMLLETDLLRKLSVTSETYRAI